METDIEKVKATHPHEARILQTEERALKLLAGELSTATREQVIAHLEQRLTALERRVQESLRRAEGGRGSTTAAPDTTVA